VDVRTEQYGRKGKAKRRRAAIVPRGKAAVASRLQAETAADDATAAAAANTRHEGGARAVEEVTTTAQTSVKSGGSLKVRAIRTRRVRWLRGHAMDARTAADAVRRCGSG
jgi:hypothetical protein